MKKVILIGLIIIICLIAYIKYSQAMTIGGWQNQGINIGAWQANTSEEPPVANTTDFFSMF